MKEKCLNSLWAKKNSLSFFQQSPLPFSLIAKKIPLFDIVSFSFKPTRVPHVYRVCDQRVRVRTLPGALHQLQLKLPPGLLLPTGVDICCLFRDISKAMFTKENGPKHWLKHLLPRHMTRNARWRSRRPHYKAAVHVPDFDTRSRFRAVASDTIVVIFL